MCFGGLALAGMLITAVFNHLLAGDTRQLVVTMAVDVAQADRVTLKQDCGALPGISVVADAGAAERQYRFPVRFALGGSTDAQESALYACINDHSTLVRGYLTEGDR